MKIRVPDYYQDFVCIADRCTDTCCAGWEVDVDDASYAYYKKVTGPFGDRLHSVMIDGTKKAEGRFQIRPDGRCPFLNDSMFCDLYTELGEEALCVTCDQYPRYTTEFGNLKETGIALSCITAGELILAKDGRPGFTVSVEEDGSLSLNNIDGTRFIHMMKARECAFDLISDRSIDIWQRAALLLLFTEDIQKHMKRPEEMKTVIAAYGPKNLKHLVSELPVSTPSEKKTAKLYKGFLKAYRKQVIIKKEWPSILAKMEQELYSGSYGKASEHFHKVYAPRMYEFENLLTYFVFRYFMKGVFDKDVLTKVKMGLVSTLMILQMDICTSLGSEEIMKYDTQVDLAHLYSREVEHSEQNFDKLCKLFRKEKTFSKDNLIYLIMQEVQK